MGILSSQGCEGAHCTGHTTKGRDPDLAPSHLSALGVLMFSKAHFYRGNARESPWVNDLNWRAVLQKEESFHQKWSADMEAEALSATQQLGGTRGSLDPRSRSCPPNMMQQLQPADEAEMEMIRFLGRHNFSKYVGDRQVKRSIRRMRRRIFELQRTGLVEPSPRSEIVSRYQRPSGGPGTMEMLPPEHVGIMPPPLSGRSMRSVRH